MHAYERVKGLINLESINEREVITRHDVKARIEEFCELEFCRLICVVAISFKYDLIILVGVKLSKKPNLFNVSNSPGVPLVQR